MDPWIYYAVKSCQILQKNLKSPTFYRSTANLIWIWHDFVHIKIRLTLFFVISTYPKPTLVTFDSEFHFIWKEQTWPKSGKNIILRNDKFRINWCKNYVSESYLFLHGKKSVLFGHKSRISAPGIVINNPRIMDLLSYKVGWQ